MIKASDLKKKNITLEQVEKFLEPLILAANQEGKTFIKTYGPEGIFGSSDLYGRDYPEIVSKTLEMLINHGYVALIKVEEKQFKQFVDIYLYVSW